MKKQFLRTLTKLIPQSQKNMSSTSTDLSASPLLHPTPQPQTSTSLPNLKHKISVMFPSRGSLVLFLAGVITGGFGEMFRSKYTEKMKFRRKCLEMEPRKLNTTQDVGKLGFRRVVCKGVFDKQRSIYVGPKPKSMAKGSENGFYVITPLLPIPNEPKSMKDPILVNRGWVPLDWEETLATTNESRKANKLLSSQLNPLSKLWYTFTNRKTIEEQDSTATHVEVVGVVRNNDFSSMYAIASYPSSLAWFVLDIPKLAQAMGFGEDTIYVEETPKDMDESRPYPAPREAEVMIHSKRIPIKTHVQTVLCNWSCVACFVKWGSIKLPNYLPGVPVIPCVLAYEFWKTYHLGLFSLIGTTDVRRDTKLDIQQKDQVKDNIDLVRDLV